MVSSQFLRLTGPNSQFVVPSFHLSKTPRDIFSYRACPSSLSRLADSEFCCKSHENISPNGLKQALFQAAEHSINQTRIALQQQDSTLHLFPFVTWPSSSQQPFSCLYFFYRPSILQSCMCYISILPCQTMKQRC